MNLNDAIKIINRFKNESVKDTINDLQKLEKSVLSANFTMVFSAAKIVKEASAQINEIVHATGIMMAREVWLNEDEKVEYLSLGAGNNKGRFDLETNLRIAEFKFGKWNEGSANDIRRRGYFSNYVSLLTANKNRDKYFVVEDKIAFVKFMNGNAKWKNVLSKNPSGFRKLQNFLAENKKDDLETVSEIFNHFEEMVTVINFKEIIKNTNK